MMVDESHPCERQGCKEIVPFDDEPECFTHSPASGSTVQGYSYRGSRLKLVCEVAVSWAGEYGFSVPEEAKKIFLAVYALCPEALDDKTREWAETESR